ncbi:MAG TPA: hypothetical protein VFV99_00355 [Kofleriaceae bacterium]|nr:hypothetical protein [Kofleriaceae bacterium]
MRTQILVALLAVGCGAQTSSGDDDPMNPDDIRARILAYKAAHPGSAGDINALTVDQVSADADAQWLLALCGTEQRPVIPLLAWEYGGSDHAWINPDASALVYCDHTPVAANSAHWTYDAASDHVTADVAVLLADENPCASRAGAEQVSGCIGDPSNFEILVDIASYNDGVDAGLSLAEASTELRLVTADGTTVSLYSAL